VVCCPNAKSSVSGLFAKDRHQHKQPASGFESILPPEARDELLRRTTRPGAPAAKKPERRHTLPWLKSALWLAPLAVTVALMVSGWTASVRHDAGSLPAPAVLTPTPVPASTPTAAAAAAAWNSWVSQPNQPVYREWMPEAGGWIVADAQCVPLRGSFIADPAPRAQPAVPRAELVSMPVRRATLVEN
jgi:hypothetical protein